VRVLLVDDEERMVAARLAWGWLSMATSMRWYSM
jgi:hypothetical protein